MSVIYPCTDSYADYFLRNLIVCKGDQVAAKYGSVSAERIEDADEEPVDVQDAKDHIWFTENAHDGAVSQWIRTARQQLERDTALALLTQRWRVTVERWPSFTHALHLPIFPVQSIDSFVYVDRNGDEQNLIVSPDTFILTSAGRPAQVGLIDSAAWPTDPRAFHSGTLELTAGWTSASAIPADLLMAMLKLVGDFAGFRESAVASVGLGSVQAAPMSYDDLIEKWVLPVVG